MALVVAETETVLCGDCFGSGEIDDDGSVSGVAGASIPCSCMGDLVVLPPASGFDVDGFMGGGCRWSFE